MRKKIPLLIFSAFALALAFAPAQVEAYPATGYDNVNTTAELILADPLDSSLNVDSVTLVGRAVIFRGDPYDPGNGRIKIDTRLDTLILRGFSTLFGDSIFATLNRDTVSKGCIQQITVGVDFPAESFFDVFYVISIGTIPSPPTGPGGSNSGTGIRGGLKLGRIGEKASATFSEPLRIGQGGQRAPNPTAIPFDGSIARVTPFGEGAVGKVATACDGEWHGGPPYISLLSWYTGDEVYASYQDPIETGCINTYPFLVETVTWFVNNLTGAPLDIVMQPIVYDADATDPQCLVPGQPICVGDSFTVTLPAGGVIVTLPMLCCVSGPYYIGIINPDLIGTGILGIVTDSVVTPARFCASYNDWGLGWKDLANTPYDFPGNVKLWSDGLASDMNNCGGFINIDPPHLFDTIWQIPPVGRQYKDPRKVPIIDPVTGDTVAWVFHKHKVDPPDSGTDTLTTWGFMDVWLGPNPPVPGQVPDDQMMLEGNAIVRRGPVLTEGGDAGVIQTEILEMNLTGVSPTFGPATLSLPFPAPGQAQSVGTELFPMDNFFDVFYRVEFTDFGQTIEPLQPSQPPRMQSLIEALPPAYNAQFEDLNGPHPIHDVQNPGVPIAWVLPVHIVHPPPPPDSGACCDPLGRCRVTTEGECIAAGDTYQGDGTTCTPNPCPKPVEEWFESIAQGTISLDPLDSNCANGVYVALSSVTAKPSIIIVEPGPYTTGKNVQTEMVQLELSGSDPTLGPITVRERADKQSDGEVTNVQATAGAFDKGDSYFDVFFEIDINGQLYTTQNTPVRVESKGVTELPPFGSDYIPPPTNPQSAPLYDANGVLVGWYCHNMHRPTIPVPCDTNDPNVRPTGACCDTLGNCTETTEGKCNEAGSHYYGDGTLCIDVNCPPEKDRDCFESIGSGTITLDVTDNQCLTGSPLSLSSGFKTADVDVDPGPYTDGQIIQTEIVAMSLSGFDPLLSSDVIIRERADKASKGKITSVLTDGFGNLTSGHSKFDVYIEVEIVALSLIVNTGNIPFVLEADISGLPPLDSAYFPPPSAAPLPLFDVSTGAHVGWFCHAEHKPTVQIDWQNVGGCCIGNNCVTTDAANCQANGGVFQGVGVPCTPNPCGGNPCPKPGDADNGGDVNIGDATFIVKYIFQNGLVPPICDQADSDGGGDVNIGDATHIVKFIFQNGAPPKCPSPGGLICL